MTQRKEILEKIQSNLLRIAEIEKENHTLKIQEYMLCDDEQRYEEKEEIIKVRENGKIIKKQFTVGRIYWQEYFEDGDNPGQGVTVERSQVVRENGIWIID